MCRKIKEFIMSDKSVDAFNYLMLTNPVLNPLGHMQHVINPAMQPNALDNPLLTNKLLLKKPKEDAFEKKEAQADETDKKADVNFKGRSEKLGAYYPDSLKAKKKNASLLCLISSGGIISSLAAYKFSELGKKHPNILLACMAIGTIGNLLGFFEINKANKELQKMDVLNTKV